MITIVKRIRIVEGTAPYTYQWSSSNSCLTFDKASGETDELIETTLMFQSQTCAPTITLTVVAACGTRQVFDISNRLPCQDMIVGDIAESNRVFSIVVGNTKCDDHTFKWEYDTSIWTLVGSTNSAYSSSIALAKSATTLTKSSTEVKVTITDKCYGCTVTKKYAYSFNVISPNNYITKLLEYLDVTTFKYKGDITFFIPQGIDPATAEIVLEPPSTIQYTKNGITVSFLTESKDVVTFPYYIKDGNNNRTLSGSITLIPEVGSASYSTIVQNTALTIPCGVRYFEIDMVPYVTSTGTINWNSFVVLGTPKYTSSSIVFDPVTKKVTYAVPSTLSIDAFKYTVADSTGAYAQAGTITLSTCPPSATANDDTLVIGAGELKKLDILSNDVTGGIPLDVNTVIISGVPDGILVSDNKDGSLNIAVGSDLEGIYTFKYTVGNILGTTSNEATVTVEVVNAGSNVSIVICN